MWAVDSTGSAFRVTGVDIVREPFWRRPRTVFGRGVRLTNWQLVAEGRPPIEEIRERVEALIKADVVTHEATGSRAETLEAVRRSTSVTEIIHALSK